MTEIDFLQQYSEAVKDSTNRTRQILLVMVIASILMFAAFWNSREGSWSNSRLGSAKALYAYLENEEAKRTTALLKERGVQVPAEILAKAEPLATPPGEDEIYTKAKELKERLPSKTLKQAEDNLFWTQKIRTEQKGQVQVPVLGISFDVNDLGLLGGFSLIVLLTWVNYSLWHHSNNLRLTFDFAKTIDDKDGGTRFLYHTYQNLAMRQVLTIPPRAETTKTSKTEVNNSETDRLKVLIRRSSKLLYGLPWLVQTIVVIHDWLTQDLGKLINVGATFRVLIAETIFWIVIAILTLICFLRWNKTFKIWKDVAKTI